MEEEREQMVREIKEKYGLKSPQVFSIMLQVPREKFIPKKYQNLAYCDGPVSIGFGQTMSQPYTVAVMSKLITEIPNSKSQITKSKIQKLEKRGKVLEIGTGSGYQAAVLSKFFKKVYTIEIIPDLAKQAAKVLASLGYKNVFVREGSGEWGWEEKAPYDAIMITAGVVKVPLKLFDQLKVGGVLIAPIGEGYDKTMTRYVKLKKQGNEKIKKEEFGIFHFVPFVKEKN